MQSLLRCKTKNVFLILHPFPDLSPPSICQKETPTEQFHCKQEPRFSICPRDPEPLHVKEEDHEVWARQQGDEEKEQIQKFKDASEPPQTQLHVCRQTVKQEDTKSALQPLSPNSESEEHFPGPQETKNVQINLPHPSTSHPLVQDGGDDSRTAACFTNPQTDQSSLHSENAHILCTVCGKALDSTKSLSVHLKSHKSPKCCQVCGKHYNSTTSLAEHMARHAGVKHRCHVCGKECSRKGDLKIHMRIHTGEKPFCCSYCQRSFTHSGHLKKHLRSHTGERPHRCHFCGKCFMQSTHLKYHLWTHGQ